MANVLHSEELEEIPQILLIYPQVVRFIQDAIIVLISVKLMYLYQEKLNHGTGLVVIDGDKSKKNEMEWAPRAPTKGFFD